MHETKEFNVVELFNDNTKAQRKIVKNYCCNFSGYHRDAHDIALTYSYFFTKLFSEPNEMIKVLEFIGEFMQKQQIIGKTIFSGNHTETEEKKEIPGLKKTDKRFAAPQWDKYPQFNFIKQ